jgi:protein required for attachment to host cells
MAAETEEILVIVFDGAGARFFKRSPNGRLELLKEVASGLHRSTSETVSDRQGRTFASAGGGIRSPYEPKHDPHKMEKHNFVHRLVKELDDSYDRQEFKHLALVAPQRSLGEFRSIAPDKLLRAVWREVPKELTQLSAHELENRLKPFFEPDTQTIEPKGRR